jgi:hypothetical protein
MADMEHRFQEESDFLNSMQTLGFKKKYREKCGDHLILLQFGVIASTSETVEIVLKPKYGEQHN